MKCSLDSCTQEITEYPKVTLMMAEGTHGGAWGYYHSYACAYADFSSTLEKLVTDNEPGVWITAAVAPAPVEEMAIAPNPAEEEINPFDLALDELNPFGDTTNTEVVDDTAAVQAMDQVIIKEADPELEKLLAEEEANTVTVDVMTMVVGDQAPTNTPDDQPFPAVIPNGNGGHVVVHAKILPDGTVQIIKDQEQQNNLLNVWNQIENGAPAVAEQVNPAPEAVGIQEPDLKLESQPVDFDAFIAAAELAANVADALTWDLQMSQKHVTEPFKLGTSNSARHKYVLNKDGTEFVLTHNVTNIFVSGVDFQYDAPVEGFMPKGEYNILKNFITEHCKPQEEKTVANPEPTTDEGLANAPL